MIKSKEATEGCFARAADDEPLFVLRAQDALAPNIVRRWAAMARGMGAPNAKVNEAYALAVAMEAWQERTGRRKFPD